jgi:hypothetical protein
VFLVCCRSDQKCLGEIPKWPKWVEAAFSRVNFTELFPYTIPYCNK